MLPELWFWSVVAGGDGLGQVEACQDFPIAEGYERGVPGMNRFDERLGVAIDESCDYKLDHNSALVLEADKKP